MGKKQEKSKRKKIRLKGLLIVILFSYLIFSCFYYFYKSPVKHINVEGNNYLKDNYIIDYLDINDQSIIKISNKKIKEKLLQLELISEAKVHKNYFGTIDIKIVENKVLFYNWNTKKIVLSNKKEVETKKDFLGVPTLINYVPDEIYEELIKKLQKVNKDILMKISIIEYSPSIVNEKIVDETRFILTMNDGNLVYINTINMDKLNEYLNIYEAIVSEKGNVTGCLYLDSNSDNTHFNNCESSIIEEEEKEDE